MTLMFKGFYQCKTTRVYRLQKIILLHVGIGCMGLLLFHRKHILSTLPRWGLKAFFFFTIL
jgi:hypothetical protein